MATEDTPEHLRVRALDHVSRAAERRAKAEADELMAMRIAAVGGASLREIAAAADRSHSTVDRMLKRPEPQD